MKLFDTTLARLKAALDARLATQDVIAGNVANADTPGYAPRRVDFHAALEHALAPATLAPTPQARPGHLALTTALPASPASAADVADVARPGGLDGNRVSLDEAMVELSKNALQYGAAARAVGKKLAILRGVVNDGMG